MQSIESVVVVNISRETRLPSQVGFGVPAILSKEADAILTNRVTEFAAASALTELVAEGFTVASETYKCAQAILSQSPRVEKIKVIKQAANVPQSNKVTIATVANAFTYVVTLDGIEYEFTSDADATDEEIRDGLIALIDAVADFNAAADASNTFDIAAAEAGKGFSISVGANLTQTETNASLGPVEEIIEAREEDDDWYFLLDTTHSNLQVELISAYIETQLKLYAYQTDDADSRDVAEASDTTGILKIIKDKNYDRSFGIWVPTADLGEYKMAAWVGVQAPKLPGSSTWKFKTARGVSSDKYTSAQLKNVQDKNGNVYVRIAGIDMFEEGVVSSGEYIDIMRGTDWISARIKEAVFGLLTTEEKVPFTDGRIESVGLQVEDILDQAVTNGILVGADNLDENGESLGPAVTVPRRSETTAVDRSKRLLTGIRFSGFYAGAVHKVQIDGNLSI